MGKKRPISARIDETTLWTLEQLAMIADIKRNHVLNEGARLWLSLANARIACREHSDAESRMKQLVRFVKLWFPEVDDLVSVENLHK